MLQRKFFASTAIALSLMLTCFAQPSEPTQSERSSEPPQELNADEVEYDMETGLARASGNVKIRRGNPNDPNAEPSSLAADQVDYNMNDGTISAEGNVLLRHDGGMATGARAMYNTETQAAYLIGNVIVVRDDFRLTCEELVNDGYGHMRADGNVHAEQRVAPTADKPEGDLRTFTGEHVDYYPDDRGHFVVPRGGIAQSSDGTFSADYMEGWLDDQYYVGQGNAHLVSPPKQLEAGGDRIDYYAAENGKAVLTGNAWAYQENNTLRGNRVTVYLADEPRRPTSTSSSSDGSARRARNDRTDWIDRTDRSEPLRPSELIQPSETMVETPFEAPFETLVEPEEERNDDRSRGN